MREGSANYDAFPVGCAVTLHVVHAAEEVNPLATDAPSCPAWPVGTLDHGRGVDASWLPMNSSLLMNYVMMTASQVLAGHRCSV